MRLSLVPVFLLAIAPLASAQQRSSRDSTADSTRNARRRALTPQLLANAYKDPQARSLIARARQARVTQDSSLRSYDVKVQQRMSVGMSVGSLGREHLAYRQESAAHVRWQRDNGVEIQMTGARVAIPLAGSEKANRDATRDQVMDNDLSPVPYFPNSETFFVGGESMETQIGNRGIINPLSERAEAFYTYASGDSVNFRLSGGRVIALREIKIRPREPNSNVTVGSLWLDSSTGQLVRAAYRLAAPAKASVSVNNGGAGTKVAGVIAGALVSGSKADITSVAVEYGLYEGRYWLPRSQTLEGYLNALFVRAPVTFEDAFTYNSVNEPLNIAKIVVDTSVSADAQFPRAPDSLSGPERQKWRDSALVTYRAARRARTDSSNKGMTVGSMRQCDSSATRTTTSYRYGARVPTRLVVPCDLDVLASSPDLPPSIYKSAEDIFGSAERDELLAGALSMSAQAPFGVFPLPRVQYGISMTRYNRVEGLSTGALIEQQLGGGYVVTAQGRYGFANARALGELGVSRTNGRAQVDLTAYSRLAASNDWGNPLSFGSSLSAFLFGRDDGFYYRATGAELKWVSETGAPLQWRAFTERERTAPVKATFSVGGNFQPNIIASEATYSGAAVRWVNSAGVDPRGFQLSTDVRLEAAASDSGYGRGALDMTLSRALSSAIAAAVTGAVGSSVGALPFQRRYFLGGVHTIRGQTPDIAQSGNAFWFTRLEFARQHEGYKTALFGDLGWTGDRSKFSEVGRPLSGAGIGFSMFDGLMRFDVARGIYPRKQTVVNLYLDARF